MAYYHTYHFRKFLKFGSDYVPPFAISRFIILWPEDCNFYPTVKVTEGLRRIFEQINDQVCILKRTLPFQVEDLLRETGNKENTDKDYKKASIV